MRLRQQKFLGSKCMGVFCSPSRWYGGNSSVKLARRTQADQAAWTVLTRCLARARMLMRRAINLASSERLTLRVPTQATADAAFHLTHTAFAKALPATTGQPHARRRAVVEFAICVLIYSEGWLVPAFGFLVGDFGKEWAKCAVEAVRHATVQLFAWS